MTGFPERAGGEGVHAEAEKTDAQTVLVVEDDRDTAAMYEEWLQGDYDVGLARSGEEAIERVDERVDVVLLDRRLPDASGLGVLERILEDDLACQVVVVSAVEPSVDFFDAGFDDYLTKPTTEADLTAAVERSLTRMTFAERYRAFDALATKLATLEANMDVEELEASSEYTDLRDRFDAMAEDLGALSVEDDEYRDLYQTKLEILHEATRAAGSDH